MIGHAAVQAGEVFSRRIAVQVGQAVGIFERGEHFHPLIFERHQVARLLRDDHLYDAIVERVGAIVFEDRHRSVVGAANA